MGEREVNLNVSRVSSVVVVISFFLPWIGSDPGFKLVRQALMAFKLAEFNSHWIIVGVAGILFALSPVFFHGLSILATTGKEPEKNAFTFATISLIIWAMPLLYSIGRGDLDADALRLFNVGFYGTLLGQIVGLFASQSAFKRSRGDFG